MSSCLYNAKSWACSTIYWYLVEEEGREGFTSFSEELVESETQTPKIWTWITKTISYDNLVSYYKGVKNWQKWQILLSMLLTNSTDIGTKSE